MQENPISENSIRKISEGDFRKLLTLLDSIKFGSVTLVIQDGRVVQMEKNEKVRLK
ncbi:MAG: YezD family protein [Clostridia bacterium]|nr:YezD family protein [Clostridia bacterium]